MTIREQYLASHAGQAEAMRALATDLMRGNLASFQQGYTYENAVIAVAEVFGIERDLVRAAVPAPIEPGCLIDGHHGHYAIPAVIRLAVAHGYIIDPFVQYALDRYDEDSHMESYPGEALIEVSDAAINWLNATRAPDGYVFMWDEGDFGLYPIGDVD